MADGADLIYRQHGGWLYRWLRSRVYCPDRAEDLVQDTFCLALRGQRLEDVREPRPFLSRIAHGLMVDECRRRDLERACLDVLATERATEAPAAENLSALLEEIAWIDALLGTLPVRARDIFLMAKLEGIPRDAIADELKVSRSTVEKDLKMVIRYCYDRIYRNG